LLDPRATQKRFTMHFLKHSGLSSRILCTISHDSEINA
jgi:hypothetical protein